VFTSLSEQLDRDENGTIDRRELYQGGRPLTRIAVQYVERHAIDVQAELKRLQKQQGTAALRFETSSSRPPLDFLRDPAGVRKWFARLDADGDGRIAESEATGLDLNRFPRLRRLADSDQDGALTERELVAAAKRLARRRAQRATLEMQAGPGTGDEDSSRLSNPEMP
jgi:hypothetical protein